MSLTVDNLKQEEEFCTSRYCESDGSSSSLLEFSRSSSRDSTGSRELVKKSSLRSRGSPPPNKHVSFSQSVTRQTEDRVTVERLKPAAKPVIYRDYYSSYYAPSYQNYYDNVAYYHGYNSHYANYHYGWKQQPQSTNNPSSMLSAWIDRDRF